MCAKIRNNLEIIRNKVKKVTIFNVCPPHECSSVTVTCPGSARLVPAMMSQRTRLGKSRPRFRAHFCPVCRNMNQF